MHVRTRDRIKNELICGAPRTDLICGPLYKSDVFELETKCLDEDGKVIKIHRVTNLDLLNTMVKSKSKNSGST